MKMVSAAKYAKAEKELKAARPYGVAISGKNNLILKTSIIWLELS